MIIDKAYTGKQGQILFHNYTDNSYYAIYPEKFSVEKIDKDEFDRENTGKAVIFVAGNYDEYQQNPANIVDIYEYLVDSITDLVEEKAKQENILQIDDKEKDDIINKACKEFLSYYSQRLDTEPFAFMLIADNEEFLNGNIYSLRFVDKYNPEDILLDGVKDFLYSYIEETLRDNLANKQSGPKI